MNLEAAVTEFIDTISQLPDNQGGAISQLPDTQGGAITQLPDTQGRAIKVDLQELHYKVIKEALCKLKSHTAQAYLKKEYVKLRQYYILCKDHIFQLLQPMLKVNTPDVLVSYTWEIIYHLSKVPVNISDIIDRGVIELGVQFVKHYHHSHDTVTSVLQVLHVAAYESPQILIEDDCVEMLLQFLNNKNQGYSLLACHILANILTNSDLSQENKSAISDKMEFAIHVWTGNLDLSREGFNDVKSWLTNQQWSVLQRLAAWEITYCLLKDPQHYAPIIVKEVGLRTLSESHVLDASVKSKLQSLGCDSVAQVKESMTDKETFLRSLGESLDSLRAKLENLDHSYNVLAQDRLLITEKDCEMIEIEITPVLGQLEKARRDNRELFTYCEELYSKHILSIMESISRIEGVSEDIISDIWQIAKDIETALDDHTLFVDRGMVEWGVTCMQTYQQNEDLVSNILQILSCIAQTHLMALMGDALQCLKQLSWDRRQELSIHACMILAQVLSAPDVTISQHDITSITDNLKQAIQSWDVDLDIRIDINDFTAVRSWLVNEKHSVVQQFAAVAIFYFIRRDASKYIPLMENEVGLETLEEFTMGTNLTPETRHVLQKIIELHKSHTHNKSAMKKHQAEHILFFFSIVWEIAKSWLYETL